MGTAQTMKAKKSDFACQSVFLEMESSLVDAVEQGRKLMGVVVPHLRVLVVSHFQW